jgi:hypothetical protein
MGLKRSFTTQEASCEERLLMLPIPNILLFPHTAFAPIAPNDDGGDSLFIVMNNV